MWLLLQSLVMFAVGCTNLVWHWTPNNYLVGILAWLAALLVDSETAADSFAAIARAG